MLQGWKYGHVNHAEPEHPTYYFFGKIKGCNSKATIDAIISQLPDSAEGGYHDGSDAEIISCYHDFCNGDEWSGALGLQSGVLIGLAVAVVSLVY